MMLSPLEFRVVLLVFSLWVLVMLTAVIAVIQVQRHHLRLDPHWARWLLWFRNISVAVITVWMFAAVYANNIILTTNLVILLPLGAFMLTLAARLMRRFA
jgi:hypothetical protein